MLRGNVIFAVLVVMLNVTPASALDISRCLRDAQLASARGDAKRACAISRRCAAAANGRAEAPEIVRRVGHFCGYRMGRCAEWEAALTKADAMCRTSGGCQASATGERLARQLPLSRSCACNLDLTVTPAAARRVVVDDAGARPFPTDQTTVSAGTHRFQFSADGHVTERRDVVCNRMKPIEVRVALRPEPIVVRPARKPTPATSDDGAEWILMGSGAAAALVGAAFQYRALQAAADANGLTAAVQDGRLTHAAARPEHGRASDRAQMSQGLAWVGFVSAAALVGTGVWFLLRDDSTADRVEVGLGSLRLRF